MPYCPKCGKEVPQGASFCPSCGASLVAVPTPAPSAPPAPPAYPMKGEGIAAILAGLIGLFLLGFGHFYVGKIGRGIALLIAGLIIDSVVWLSMLAWWLIFPLLITVIFGIIALVLWAWSIYDAYTLAKRYNEHLRTSGKPPW